MSTTRSEQLSEVLPAEPASVRAARRFVAGALETWGLHDLAGDAALLVSELVTNAVLHAGTEVEVRVHRSGAGARVEVEDGSAVLPSPRTYERDAVTGRGLQILESTATAWGVEPRRSGKVVWFDVGGAPSQPAAVDASAAPRDALVVRWEALPTRLAKATLEHGDALLRELALLSFDDDAGSLSVVPRAAPPLDVSGLLAAIDTALAATEVCADVELALTPTAPDAALRRLALVDEADRMARDGALLTPAPLPEVIACRRWLMSQIVAQASGEPPVRWQLTDAPPPATDWEPLTDDEAALLGSELPDSLVVDQENRMVFVGERAAAALGSLPSDLVGRRLTDIIPNDLREAHLVGFTRYHLTGRGSLHGQPLHLRARHAAGSDIDVVITLGELPRRAGRYRHRARLEPRRAEPVAASPAGGL